MSEKLFESLLESGRRVDYIADIQVLKAAGIDPLAELEEQDRPAGYTQEQLDSSGDEVDWFWNLDRSGDDGEADFDTMPPYEDTILYHTSLNARDTARDYIRSLVGKVGDYSLGHITEDEVSLYASLDPAHEPTAVDIMLEARLLKWARWQVQPSRFRKISAAVIKHTGFINEGQLEVKGADMQALQTVAMRLSDVLSRMDPVDLSISNLPLRGKVGQS